VSAFVLGNDLEPCSHGKTNYGNERILESDAVYIAVTSMTNEFPGCLISMQEAVQNGRLDLRARNELLGSTDVFGPSGWLDVGADEPSAKPPRIDVLNGRAWFA